MNHNSDFSQRIVLDTTQIQWRDSPMPGVRRRMLDRVGGEVARATSIVSYAPDSHFSPHVHTGGEEFIVLDGVFQDEHGDYPAGSYVRNPPQSSHTPGSDEGCIIFVKLWQFQPDDRQHVNINMQTLQPTHNNAGVSSTTLFEDKRERVQLQTWDAGSAVNIDTDGGAELLVLDGSISVDAKNYPAHSWLRAPLGRPCTVTTGDNGARVWIKSGHLKYVDEQIKQLQA